MVETIQIRNPSVIEAVDAARRNGVGRSFTETAENMILADASRRRAEQDRKAASNAPAPQLATT